MRPSVLVPMLVMCASALLSGASAAPLVLSRVTIRAYNNFGVATKILERAQRISDGILNEAGVQAVWRHCRMASGPSATSADDCRDELDDDEVIVRIVRAPAGFGGANASFGYSLVNTDARRGSLATVFGDHVSAASDRVRLEPGTLLGRAMAHELGHLLLGTNTHSTEGLMRAVWPDAALLSRATSDWSFSPLDLARLRMALSFSSSTSFPTLR